jgi:hypothetical protein
MEDGLKAVILNMGPRLWCRSPQSKWYACHKDILETRLGLACRFVCKGKVWAKPK